MEPAENSLMMLAGRNDTHYYWDYEIGPGQWFVKDYFLYVKLAWTTLQIHIGDKKVNVSKPINLRLEIPFA